MFTFHHFVLKCFSAVSELPEHVTTVINLITVDVNAYDELNKLKEYSLQSPSYRTEVLYCVETPP